MSRARRGPALAAAAGAIAGIAAEWTAYDLHQPGHWLPDLVTGWALIGCGLAGRAARPASRSGPLMTATGFTWFAGTFSSAAIYLHRGPLVHLMLSYPGLTLVPRRARLTVAAGYGAAVVPAAWRSEAATIVLSALLVGAAAVTHARAMGYERRASAYALRATVLLSIVLVGVTAVRVAVPTPEATEATLLVYEAALCLLAGGLLVGLLQAPWGRVPVTDLVLELGERQSGSLRDALAGALGDPSLEIGYRVDDGYVDASGRPVRLPAPGSDRRVTPVERDGQAIAVLVHDPAVLDDPSLARALAAAARLAAVNARLQAEVRAHLAELRASRRRLLHASDEERRRLERRLRETVERRLADLAGRLQGARAGRETLEGLRSVENQLARARAELRDLAAGLDPVGAHESGLSGALAALVARSPVPVALDVAEAPLPDQIATAVYFVCAEALANVVKYAGASRATISVSAGRTHVRVVIEDDGVGGADPAAGTGLRGIADRLEALGGSLTVDSPPRRGTRIIAELRADGEPC